jgi:toxin ParE1/3/4
MEIRWSPEAADDIERIYRHIQQNNPAAAKHVAQTLYEECKALKTFPNRGRLGREEGSRELIFSRLPNIAVYRVAGNIIEISRIWHGAQDWP